MAATNKNLQIQIDREVRITIDSIEQGQAERAAIFARILFQTTAKRYHIREPRHFDGTKRLRHDHRMQTFAGRSNLRS
jgi:hypothetical protein